jgi:hypothetical protein
MGYAVIRRGHDSPTRIGNVKSATSRGKNVNAALTHNKDSLFFGRDREGTVHLAHVPFQVTWEDRMNVYHHDTDVSGPNVLLMREIGVEGNENIEFRFSCRKELVIVVVFPSLIPSRYHLVFVRQLGT